MSADQIINVSLHSQDAIRNANTYRFELQTPIDMHGFNSILQITHFQCLNTVPNVSKMHTFMDKELQRGFYTTTNLQKFMQSVLDVTFGSNAVSCKFDDTTLKFAFFSDTDFELTGTLLDFLGITSGDAIQIEGRFDYITGITHGIEYTVEMKTVLDLYASIENVHVLNRNLFISPSVSTVGEEFSNEIAKIPIGVAFGTYIVASQDSIASKSQIYNRIVQAVELDIVDDSGISIDTSFSMTLQIELYDDGSREFLNETTPAKKKGGGNVQYAVVRQQTANLKDARVLYQERLLERKKEYLLSHPLHQFDEDDIEDMKQYWVKMKSELLKIIRKRRKKNK